MTLIVAIGLAAALAVAALRLWRLADRAAERRLAAKLRAGQPARPARFDPAMVAGLPDPARRYFLHAIRPGTPLSTVAEIRMKGRFGPGDRAAPGYMEMRARQTLAAPAGFVWAMSARRGAMRLSGSDAALEGRSWTRFWLMGLLPVARIGGNPDHARSAFGRYVAEAAFWTPAAILPGPGIAWEAVDQGTARVTVSRGGLAQAVDLTVDAEGRPVTVAFTRWSDANPERTYRPQPFGGFLSEFRDVGGFRLPTHIEAGNQFGTEAYFPFFIVDVTEIAFPDPAGDEGEAGG